MLSGQAGRWLCWKVEQSKVLGRSDSCVMQTITVMILLLMLVQVQ